jgi:AcrR family transcriptional regulator
MARPKKSNSDPTNTRSRVIEAADALLHQHGYMGVSMDAIAERIGIRKASLYYHFPDGKDQIVLEIAERLIQFDAQGFEEAIQTEQTARARLEAMARFIFKDTRQTNLVLRDSSRFMPQEHQQKIAQLFFSQMFPKVQSVFETGIKNAELRPHDTRFATFSFLSLLSEMNAPEHQTAWNDLPTQITDLLLNGLTVQPKPPRSRA